MSTHDPLAVAQQYGADPEVFDEYNCVPIRARIVRDVLKVRTQSGSRALKKVSAKAVRLDYAFLCAEHVAARGFPNVPRFIRNQYGDPYVVHSTGTYYMTNWWPGRELDVHKTDELFEGLQILAEWHDAAHGFNPEDVRVPRQTSFLARLRGQLTELARYKEICQAEADPSPFQKLFLAAESEIRQRLENATLRLDDCAFADVEADAAQDDWVCHGEFTRHHVTVDDTSWTVWNYDRVHPGLPLMDVALYLHRYLPGFDWSSAVLSEAVERYRSAGGYPGGQDVLAGLLEVPLRTVQVVSWYFHRLRDWDEEDFVDALEASLEQDTAREFALQEAFEASNGIPILMMSGTGEPTDVPIVSGESHEPAPSPVRTDGSRAEVALASGHVSGTESEDGEQVIVEQDHKPKARPVPSIPQETMSLSPAAPAPRSSPARPAKKAKSQRKRRRGSDGKRPRTWGHVTPTDSD